jgi:hypothetical protein
VRFIFFVLVTFLLSTFNSSFAETNNAEIGSEEFFTSIYLDKACLLYGEADLSTGTTFQSVYGEASTDLQFTEFTEFQTKTHLSSKTARPLSSRVVECITGTLSNLFLESNPATGFTLFQEFQSVVKPMVILVLILYIVFNGFLISTGQMLTENPKQDIIMFIIKFILVFYFSVGDAWKDFFFVALRSISSTLGGILVEAGANTTGDGCIFTGPGVQYPVGKEYIAFFDTLDCKFGNYLGWFRGRKVPILVPIGVTMFFVKGVGPMLFTLVYVVAIQLITLLARVAHLYLASIIVLTLLIYASPLIVPMVLFKPTEKIFQNWLSRILGLTVHPIIVLAFAGIMLCITDRIYYGADPDSHDMFKPFGANSNTGLTMTNSTMMNSTWLSTGGGQGADINENCYGGIGSNNLVNAIYPLTAPVCVMRWAEQSAYGIPFPIPFLIEIIEFYFIWRIDLAILFFVVMLYLVVSNLLLGMVLEKLESVIAAISGENMTGMVGEANMLQTTVDGMHKGHSMGKDGAAMMDKFTPGGGGGGGGGGGAGGGGTPPAP